MTEELESPGMELVAMIGPCAAGKTSTSLAYEQRGYARVSVDELATELGILIRVSRDDLVDYMVEANRDRGAMRYVEATDDHDATHRRAGRGAPPRAV